MVRHSAHDLYLLCTSNVVNRSFYGQVPLVMASILVTAFQMPSMDKPKEVEGSTRSKLGRIDFVGIISFTTTILLLLFAIQSFKIGEMQQTCLFYILCGSFLASITIFLLLECFWAKNPLIPLDLLKKSFGAYCLSQLLLATARSAVGDFPLKS